MRKALVVVIFFSMFVFSSTGFSQIVEKTSDLSAYVGILSSLEADVKIQFEGQQEQTGKDEGETELMFGARYNYNVDTNNALEGTIGFMFPEKQKVYLYHVNYKYNITLSNEMVVPFVTGGVGAITISPDEGESSTNLSFNFGGGLGYFVGENLAIRVDVRDIIMKRGDQDIEIQGAQGTIEGYTVQNIEATGGITYYFI
ncbi:MAG: outer membrane beta-barrel protein [Candidatus Glassbacteria bacterium]